VNNRATILASLILVFAIGTNFIMEQNDESLAATPALNNDPDLYMLSATVTQFDNQGKIQNEIGADRFTHFPLTDVTALIQPKMRLFSETEDDPWDIVAKNGRLLSQSDYREQVVELWDDVLAIQRHADGKFINIQTESLNVFPGREYAETNKKVSIDDNTGRTTAAAMKAYFKSDKFIFYSTPTERVKTVLLPESSSTPKNDS
jgi:lipopolysaccharide export system protein LptC